MDTLPWYRQFWPWFIFGLPAAVVVAGLTTWWIAESHRDYLVVDDYYKDGLAINLERGKEQRALELGLVASLSLSGNVLRVELRGTDQPPALQLDFSHPLDGAQDFSLKLAMVEPGIYETLLPQALNDRWLWRLQPLGHSPEALWRLDGEFISSGGDER
jgi:hypothetical protein